MRGGWNSSKNDKRQICRILKSKNLFEYLLSEFKKSKKQFQEDSGGALNCYLSLYVIIQGISGQLFEIIEKISNLLKVA